MYNLSAQPITLAPILPPCHPLMIPFSLASSSVITYQHRPVMLFAVHFPICALCACCLERTPWSLRARSLACFPFMTALGHFVSATYPRVRCRIEGQGRDPLLRATLFHRVKGYSWHMSSPAAFFCSVLSAINGGGGGVIEMSQFWMSHSQIFEEQGDFRCICRLQDFSYSSHVAQKVYVLCKWMSAWENIDVFV